VRPGRLGSAQRNSLQTREPGNLPGGVNAFFLFERKRESLPSPVRANVRAHIPIRLAAAALLALAAAARAGEAAPAPTQESQGGLDGGDPTTVDAATVEIVADRPAGVPAAQVTVIDPLRYAAGEVRSIAELLTTAPGVTIHAAGGPGQQSTLSLRGASADESLVLFDGIPLQGPGGGAIDLSTVPVLLLERIVVTRGVLSAQLGAGALGGAVELIPRAPERERLAGGTQLSLGSFGTAQLGGDLSVPLGQGALLAAVQLERTAGDFDYSRQLTPDVPSAPFYDFTRANADSRRASVILHFADRLLPATELDLVAQATAGERGLPGPSTATTPRSRALDQGGLAGARLSGSWGSAIWSARAWTRFDHLELRGVEIIGDCSDGTPGCPRQSERSVSGRGQLEVQAPLGERQWLRATASGGDELISGSPTGFHSRGLGSLALADDIRLSDRASLHPALRLDQAGRDLGLSPALGASLRPLGPDHPLELRASAGASFRAATLSELYLDQGGVVPAPDLRPEHALSADAGVAFHTGRLAFSAGVFLSQYTDLILYEQYPPAKARPFNIGKARIGGVELEAVVTLPQGFVAEASYTFLDAINLRPGLQENHHLSYRPPQRLFVRLARRGDRLEGYAEFSATSQMPRNQFDTAFLPAQRLISIGAGVRTFGPVWLDLEAKNLLDDRTLEDLFQYPLPGLSITALLRARL